MTMQQGGTSRTSQTKMDREGLFSSFLLDLNELSQEERLLKEFPDQIQLCESIEIIRQKILTEYVNTDSSHYPLLNSFKDEYWLQIINYMISNCSLKSLLLMIQAIQQLIRRTSKNRAQSLLDQIFVDQCHAGIHPEVIYLFQEKGFVSSSVLLELTRVRCDLRSKSTVYLVTMTDSTELQCLNHALYSRLIASPSNVSVSQSSLSPSTLSSTLSPKKTMFSTLPSSSTILAVLTPSSKTSMTYAANHPSPVQVGKSPSSSSSFSSSFNLSPTKKSSFFLLPGNYRQHSKLMRLKNQRKIDEYLWDLFQADHRLLIHRLLFQPFYYPVEYWPSQEAVDRIFIAAANRHNLPLMFMLLNHEDIHHSTCPTMFSTWSTHVPVIEMTEEEAVEADPYLMGMKERQAQRKRIIFPSLDAFEKAFQNAVEGYLSGTHQDITRIQWYLTGESNDGSCLYRQFAYRPSSPAIVKALSTMHRNNAKQQISALVARNNPVRRLLRVRGRHGFDIWQPSWKVRNTDAMRCQEVHQVLRGFCDEMTAKAVETEKARFDASVEQVRRMQYQQGRSTDIHSFSATTVVDTNESTQVATAAAAEEGGAEVLQEVEQLLHGDEDEEEAEDLEEGANAAVGAGGGGGEALPVAGPGHQSVHKRKTLNDTVLRFVEDNLVQANVALFEENRQVDQQLKELVDTYISEGRRAEAHKRLDHMLRRRSTVRGRRGGGGGRVGRVAADPDAMDHDGAEEHDGAMEVEDHEEIIEDDKAFDMFNTILTYLNHFHPNRRESWIVGFMEESIEARSCLAGALERAVTGLRCVEDEEINRFFGQVEAKSLINLFLTKKMNIFYDNNSHGSSSSSSSANATERPSSSKLELCNILANRYHITARSDSDAVRAALLDYMRGEIAAYQVDLQLYGAEIEATADVITDCFDMLMPYLPA